MSEMTIPSPRFELGDKVEPGPDARTPDDIGVGIVRERIFQPDVGGDLTEPTWLYRVEFEKMFAQMIEARMLSAPVEVAKAVPPDGSADSSLFPTRCIVTAPPHEYPVEFLRAKVELGIIRFKSGEHEVFEENGRSSNREPTQEEIDSCVVLPPEVAHSLVAEKPGEGDIDGRQYAQQNAPREASDAPAPDGWQGTEPAEGTRRATGRDAELDLFLPDANEEVIDVALGPDGEPYVAIDSLIYYLTDVGDLTREEAPAEIEEDERPATVIAGRSGGKRAAMIAAIRRDAATEADAEAVVDELERTGRAFMFQGRHAQPGACFSAEGDPRSPGQRFIDWITGRD